MKITKNALNVATALKFNSIGTAKILENIKKDMDEETIIKHLSKINKDVKSKFYECRDSTQEELECLDGYIDGCIAFCDDEFPQYETKNIKNSEKPILLTYKGDLGLLDTKLLKIAVIGFLNPCDKIRHLEERLLDKMLELDAVIVSGLANGCDKIAHEYTLKKNGATVAILPSTLKDILPTSNTQLAQEIVTNGGLLISEYYTKPKNTFKELSKRYIDRDRLQALFSDAVCLVASYSKEDRFVNGTIDKSKDIGSRHALNAAQNWDIARLAPRGIENDARFHLNKEILKNGAIEINNENIKEILKSLKEPSSLF